MTMPLTTAHMNMLSWPPDMAPRWSKVKNNGTLRRVYRASWCWHPRGEPPPRWFTKWQAACHMLLLSSKSLMSRWVVSVSSIFRLEIVLSHWQLWLPVDDVAGEIPSFCSFCQRKLKRLKHFKTHVEIGKALCPSILDGTVVTPTFRTSFFKTTPTFRLLTIAGQLQQGCAALPGELVGKCGNSNTNI